MAEQTSYLCTVLVDPSPSYISLGSSQEWYLQLFGMTRLSCKNTFNGVERNFNVSLTSHPWIKMLRCPMFKILGITDPKSAHDSILAIRIFMNVTWYYAHPHTLETLLQENTFQDTLEEQPSNHVFIEYRILNCNDRTIRKQTRIAQDAFKTKKISTDISESCPQIVSQMMRYKERFQTPNVPLMSHMNLSQLDYSLSFDWNSFQIVHDSMTTKSVLPQQVDFFTSEISFTEESLLLSWDISFEERPHPHVVTEDALLLEQCMLIVQHQESNTILKWTETCRQLGISQAMITSSILPADATSVKVLFVEASSWTAIQSDANITAQTFMYMLRLQADQDLGVDTISFVSTNVSRARKLYFHNLKRSLSLIDVPLAWCQFGIVCEDLRGLAKTSLLTYESPWSPHFVLREGFGDLHVSRSRGLANLSGLSKETGPRIIHGINLDCPKKWLRSVRTKHIHVAPEAAVIKWAQVIVKTHPMDPEQDQWQNEIDKDSIMIRGSHNSVVNADQAAGLIEEHFASMPKHTIGQFFHNLPGTLRKRGLSISNEFESESLRDQKEFDCNICQETQDFSKHAMTQTLCGHSFCLDCGNQVFKAFQNVNAAGTLTIDCPCCRTALCVFDTFRILNDPEYSFKYVWNLEKAIETERANLQGPGPMTRRSSQKITYMIVSCEKEPPKDWHTTVDSQVHTLFITHIHPATQFAWQIQFVKWIALSKKTNRIMLFGNSTNQSIVALKTLLS